MITTINVAIVARRAEKKAISQQKFRKGKNGLKKVIDEGEEKRIP